MIVFAPKNWYQTSGLDENGEPHCLWISSLRSGLEFKADPPKNGRDTTLTRDTTNLNDEE